MINLREADRKQQLQNKEMKMKVLEQDSLIHELESALEQLQLQYDRRLTLQQKEQEQAIQLLLNHFKGKSLGSAGLGVCWGVSQAPRHLPVRVHSTPLHAWLLCFV